MDRDSSFYRKPLHEQDLTGLAELCLNVARHPSAKPEQWDMAYTLRVEWVRLFLGGSLDPGKTEPEKSLKKRMADFLAKVPSWMLSGA
jgi:hypothetical protein